MTLPSCCATLSVLQFDLNHQIQLSKAREDQWRNFVTDAEKKNHEKLIALSADKEMALKEKEQVQAELAASEKRDAMNQSRLQDLQNVAEQLRKREQAIEREKVALQVQLERATKSTLKWKRHASQWKRETIKKGKAAACDRAAAPIGSKQGPKAM